MKTKYIILYVVAGIFILSLLGYAAYYMNNLAYDDQAILQNMYTHIPLELKKEDIKIEGNPLFYNKQFLEKLKSNKSAFLEAFTKFNESYNDARKTLDNDAKLLKLSNITIAFDLKKYYDNTDIDAILKEVSSYITIIEDIDVVNHHTFINSKINETSDKLINILIKNEHQYFYTWTTTPYVEFKENYNKILHKTEIWLLTDKTILDYDNTNLDHYIALQNGLIKNKNLKWKLLDYTFSNKEVIQVIYENFTSYNYDELVNFFSTHSFINEEYKSPSNETVIELSKYYFLFLIFYQDLLDKPTSDIDVDYYKTLLSNLNVYFTIDNFSFKKLEDIINPNTKFTSFSINPDENGNAIFQNGTQGEGIDPMEDANVRVQKINNLRNAVDLFFKNNSQIELFNGYTYI